MTFSNLTTLAVLCIAQLGVSLSPAPLLEMSSAEKKCPGCLRFAPRFPQLLQYGRWSMSVSWGFCVCGVALLQFVGGSFPGRASGLVHLRSLVRNPPVSKLGSTVELPRGPSCRFSALRMGKG